jgi:hypothetical protein
MDRQEAHHQQVALPQVLREEALTAYHDSESGGAHLATKRVYEAHHCHKRNELLSDYKVHQ